MKYLVQLNKATAEWYQVEADSPDEVQYELDKGRGKLLEKKPITTQIVSVEKLKWEEVKNGKR